MELTNEQQLNENQKAFAAWALEDSENEQRFSRERVLQEIEFAMMDDVPDLQKLYDRIAGLEEDKQ